MTALGQGKPCPYDTVPCYQQTSFVRVPLAAPARGMTALRQGKPCPYDTPACYQRTFFVGALLAAPGKTYLNGDKPLGYLRIPVPVKASR